MQIGLYMFPWMQPRLTENLKPRSFSISLSASLISTVMIPVGLSSLNWANKITVSRAFCIMQWLECSRFVKLLFSWQGVILYIWNNTIYLHKKVRQQTLCIHTFNSWVTQPCAVLEIISGFSFQLSVVIMLCKLNRQVKVCLDLLYNETYPPFCSYAQVCFLDWDWVESFPQCTLPSLRALWRLQQWVRWAGSSWWVPCTSLELAFMLHAFLNASSLENAISG